jgi:hypothetical protein
MDLEAIFKPHSILIQRYSILIPYVSSSLLFELRCDFLPTQSFATFVPKQVALPATLKLDVNGLCEGYPSILFQQVIEKSQPKEE